MLRWHRAAGFAIAGELLMRIVFKGIGIIFLLWLGMHIWYAFSPSFLPGPAVAPGTWVSLDQELVGVFKGGPEEERAYREQLDRARPFDNSLVINYVMPLFLVWLLCAIGKARRLSPIVIFCALTVLWLTAFLVVRAMDLILFEMIGSYLILLFIFPFLFFVPRQLDRALAKLLNEEDGWLARRHGPDAARAGHGALVFLVTGIFIWVLWRTCDGLDGGGIPDTFALVVRSAAVAYGVFLLIRSHVRIAM